MLQERVTATQRYPSPTNFSQVLVSVIGLQPRGPTTRLLYLWRRTARLPMSTGLRGTQRPVRMTVTVLVTLAEKVHKFWWSCFALAESEGGMVHVKSLGSKWWNGRGLNLSVTSIRVIKFKRTWCAEHVARFGEDRNEHLVAVEKTEGKGPLGRPRCRRKLY